MALVPVQLGAHIVEDNPLSAGMDYILVVVEEAGLPVGHTVAAAGTEHAVVVAVAFATEHHNHSSRIVRSGQRGDAELAVRTIADCIEEQLVVAHEPVALLQTHSTKPSNPGVLVGPGEDPEEEAVGEPYTMALERKGSCSS